MSLVSSAQVGAYGSDELRRALEWRVDDARDDWSRIRRCRCRLDRRSIEAVDPHVEPLAFFSGERDFVWKERLRIRDTEDGLCRGYSVDRGRGAIAGDDAAESRLALNPDDELGIAAGILRRVVLLALARYGVQTQKQ